MWFLQSCKCRPKQPFLSYCIHLFWKLDVLDVSPALDFFIMEAGVTLSVSILLIIIHAVGANGYSTFGAEHFNFSNTQVIKTSLPFAFLLVEGEGGCWARE
jgi:hypothetical protein